MRVTIPNGFAPRKYQIPPLAYFDRGGNRAVTVWHRRAGKDLVALHHTARAALLRKGVYWHVFPTLEQGRKAIWEGHDKDGHRTIEQAFPAAIRRSPKQFSLHGDMVVELVNGSIWRLMGSDRMEVVGSGPRGVVLSEYSLAKPRTWDLIRPMLRENDGWAWFNFTPRGKNHAKKLFDMAKQDASWFCDLKTLFDTRAYNPEATIAEERASGMPEELIQQEYLCDWTAANVGSFYGVALSTLEARGGLVDFEYTGDVFTSWDLGRADDTAIWWWGLNPSGGVDLLDHYASHGEDLPHYFDVVRSRGQLHNWKYRRHFLPHDARAKTLSTRVSVQDQFNDEFGTAMVVVGPQLALKDGIQATRKMLGHPATRIHTRCSNVASSKDCDGVEALRSYHREWDDDTKAFSERPVHDWASHTSDACRGVAMVPEVVAMLQRKPDEAPKRPKVEMSSNLVAIDGTDILEARGSPGFKRRRI